MAGGHRRARVRREARSFAQGGIRPGFPARAKFKGRDSGFEFDVSPASDIAETYSEFESEFAGKDVAGNFRWGGDLHEMACALAASAALAQLSDGVWFDPQEGACFDSAGAIEQARSGVEAAE